jgi:hypothetical protein
MKMFVLVLILQAIIVWRSHVHAERRKAMRSVRRKLAYLRRYQGHHDAQGIASTVDGILWEQGFDPQMFGLVSLDQLYILATDAEKRHAALLVSNRSSSG